MDYIQVLNAIIIIIVTFFAMKVSVYALRKIGTLATKSKNNLDDHLIEASKVPLMIFIMSIGIYIATVYLVPSLEMGDFDLRKGFFVLFALVIAISLSRIVNVVFNWYAKEVAIKTKTDVDDTLLPIIKRIFSILIYSLVLLMILDKLKINISPILASLGVAGLAVGLALQDTLSNFFSAIYLTVDRPIKIGDYIELDSGTRGYVTDIGWRSTKIRTLAGNYIIFPNSKLSQAVITNYEGPNPEMNVKIVGGVSYDSDLDKVEKIAKEVVHTIINENEGAVKNYEPLVRFSALNESSIDFKIILKVKSFVDQFKLQHDLIKELVKRFREENITIPFPQRDIHLIRDDGKEKK